MGRTSLTFPLSDITASDTESIGKKAIFFSGISEEGLLIPQGFVITSTFFENYINDNNLTFKLSQLVQTINFERYDSISQVASHMQKLIEQGNFSRELTDKIFKEYEKLGKLWRQAEVTLCTYSFCENDNYTSEFTSHHISGETNLLLKIKENWIKFYTTEHLLRNYQRGLFPLHKHLASVVTKDIKSLLSGTIYTTSHEDKYYIKLEIRNNKDITTTYFLDKRNYKLRKEPELRRNLQNKIKIELSDNQLIHFGLIARKIEKKYYFPQEISFSVDKNKVYITNINPTSNPASVSVKPSSSIKRKLVLAKAVPASPGIYTGPVRIIHTSIDSKKLLPGEVLVTSQANPNLVFSDFVEALKKAKALVIEQGSKQSHAVLLAKKLGIPSIIKADGITRIIKTGTVVTVNGLTGEVFKGSFLQENSRVLYQ